jgi:hypothetical protein
MRVLLMIYPGARAMRLKLRGAVRAVNKVLTSLRLEKRPDKDIHRQDREGIRLHRLPFFGSRVLELAEATIERFVDQATRPYEQGRGERVKAPSFGRYAPRWLSWAHGGLAGFGWRSPRRPTPYQRIATFPRANTHRDRVCLIGSSRLTNGGGQLRPGASHNIPTGIFIARDVRLTGCAVNVFGREERRGPGPFGCR